MSGLCGALLALLVLWWSDRYFTSLNPRLWVLLVAGLGAIGIGAVCGLMAHRDRLAAKRDAMWNLEVSRLSDKTQAVADEVHELKEHLTHPDGALRLALKAELANQGVGAGRADYDAEIAELKKAIRALEELVVPETAFYLRGFMDGQGDGGGEHSAD